MKPRGNAVDRHIGDRLRTRREQLGLSKEQVAEALETSAEDLDRMEDGTMRISAQSLFRLTRELDVAPSYFFDRINTAR